MDQGVGWPRSGRLIWHVGYILTPHLLSRPALHQPVWIFASDFSGADPSDPIGVDGALLGVRGHMLCHSFLLTGAGYGTGQPAYLFQLRLGLGC